jgi:hypothetical protein
LASTFWPSNILAMFSPLVLSEALASLILAMYKLCEKNHNLIWPVRRTNLVKKITREEHLNLQSNSCEKIHEPIF